jgi:hypothetical protein
LGVVLTSPPAVLGGPLKTGSKLPVLGEIDDYDDSDEHDVIISDYELGLDLGLDSDSWTYEQTDSTTPSADRQQPVLLAAPELTSWSQGERKATPPPRGQETRPPERDRLKT